MDKVVVRPHDAFGEVSVGASVLVGGWGGVGVPRVLIDVFASLGVGELTVVSNNCGTGEPHDVGQLFEAGLVKRVVTSFPTHPGAVPFRAGVEAGAIEIELVPQGTLVEKIRSGGVGLGGFYTPTGAGTDLAAGRQVVILDGRPQVFEQAIHADIALVHAWQGDRFGNLRYRGVGRAFNSVMAMNAKMVVAEVEELVAELDPEDIHTPGIFVGRLLEVGDGTQR